MQKVSKEFIEQVIDCHKPIGEFYTLNNNGSYTAIDNTTGDAWTEDFESLQDVKDFFDGKDPEEIKDKKDNMIEINDDSVYIRDEHGEIVSWVEDEWYRDPSIITSIANAIDIYHNEGPESLREHISNPVFKFVYASQPLPPNQKQD